MSGTDWIAKLKVKELQDELRARGLTVSGKKADLAERLKAAVEAEEQAADAPAEGSSPTKAATAAAEAPDEAAAAAPDEPAAAAADDATEQAGDAAEVPEVAELQQVAVAGEPDQQLDSTEAAPDQQASAGALEEQVPADEGHAGTEEAPEVAAPSTHPETAAAAEPAVAGDAEVDAVMPTSPAHKAAPAESEQEEVLDFEGTPGLEAHMAPETDAQQQQQQDGDVDADVDMQGADGGEGEQMEDQAPAAHQAPAQAHKRPSPDSAPASTEAPTVDRSAQQEQKRAKFTPIPAPEQRHKAAGSTPAQPPAAQAAGDPERRSGTPAEAAGSGSERKRKHEPIPIPSKAPAAKPLRHSGSGLSREGSAAVLQGEPAPTPDQEQQVAEAVAAAGEVPADATTALVINGLKRPYTPQALTQLLSETGFVQGLFLTKLKDTAYVVFKEASQAHATRTKLQSITWPPASRSQLQLSFVAEDLAASVIQSQQAPTEGALRRALSSGAASSGPKVAAAANRTASDVDASPAGAEAAPQGRAAAGVGSKPSVLDRLGSRGEPDAAEPADVDPPPQPAAAPAEDEPLTLDDLFRKTKTKPHLYFLPLTDEQVAAKKPRTAPAAAAAGGGEVRASGGD